MNKKTLILIAICMFCMKGLMAQFPPDTTLYKSIMRQDSLLFEIGFNTCDLSQFETLLSSEFRFYHDKSGITPSKAEFVSNLKNGLCASSTYQSRRELIPGTTEIYPLYNDGKLYGALQTGEHRFFEKIDSQPETVGSIAKFTHVWILEGGLWRLQESLSYDHQMKE